MVSDPSFVVGVVVVVVVVVAFMNRVLGQNARSHDEVDNTLLGTLTDPQLSIRNQRGDIGACSKCLCFPTMQGTCFSIFYSKLAHPRLTVTRPHLFLPITPSHHPHASASRVASPSNHLLRPHHLFWIRSLHRLHDLSRENAIFLRVVGVELD